LDLGVFALPRSRAVPVVHTVRLRSAHFLGLAKTPISGALFFVGFAALTAGKKFCP